MSEGQREQLFREFDKWMYDRRGYSPATRECYLTRARAANTWLVANRRRSLFFATPTDLKAYLFSAPADARIRNSIRQALLAAGGFLIEEELAVGNPAADLPRLPEPESIPEALEADVAAIVWKAAQTFPIVVTCLVGVYLWTAVRRTAGRLLEWPNIRPGWLTVFEKGRGGSTKQRRLPIHPELDIALCKWRARTTEPRWVFPSPRRTGQPVSKTWVAMRLNDVGEVAGVHLHPHLFRHTAATAMLEGGADIRDVQEFLGHASLKTTQIYTKVRPARLQETVGRLPFGGDNGNKPPD